MKPTYHRVLVFSRKKLNNCTLDDVKTKDIPAYLYKSLGALQETNPKLRMGDVLVMTVNFKTKDITLKTYTERMRLRMTAQEKERAEKEQICYKCGNFITECYCKNKNEKHNTNKPRNKKTIKS